MGNTLTAKSTRAPTPVNNKFYAVETANSVFISCKINNRTDPESVLMKLKLVEAITKRQISELKRKPIITKADRVHNMRPFSAKRMAPTFPNFPGSMESLTEGDRNNLLFSYRCGRTKSPMEESKERPQSAKLELFKFDKQCLKQDCPSKQHQYALDSLRPQKEPTKVIMHVDSNAKELIEKQRNLPSASLAKYISQYLGMQAQVKEALTKF